jgi:hypothetical protein
MAARPYLLTAHNGTLFAPSQILYIIIDDDDCNEFSHYNPIPVGAMVSHRSSRLGRWTIGHGNPSIAVSGHVPWRQGA